MMEGDFWLPGRRTVLWPYWQHSVSWGFLCVPECEPGKSCADVSWNSGSTSCGLAF